MADAKATKTYKEYVAHECTNGFGIMNGIINAVVFVALLMGDFSIEFDFMHGLKELAPGTIVLGIVLSLIVNNIARKALNKGEYTATAADAGLGGLLPKKAFPMAVVVGLIVAFFAANFTVIVWGFMGFDVVLNWWQMMIFKGVTTGLAGAIAGYLVIGHVVADELSNN